MKAEAPKDVDRILRENRRMVDEALKRGVRRAMLRHKNEGSSVVVERDDKIEWLKPEGLGFWCHRVAEACAVTMEPSRAATVDFS
jgi:hypothetical protein